MIGFFVESVNSVLQWITSALYGGYIAANLLKWHWWRFNGNGYFWGMIIGGAVGNVIDRIRLGAVFDFLDFHIGESHWPAFNVADSFICIGATILIMQSLFNVVKKNEVK